VRAHGVQRERASDAPRRNTRGQSDPAHELRVEADQLINSDLSRDYTLPLADVPGTRMRSWTLRRPHAQRCPATGPTNVQQHEARVHLDTSTPLKDIICHTMMCALWTRRTVCTSDLCCLHDANRELRLAMQLGLASFLPRPTNATSALPTQHSTHAKRHALRPEHDHETMTPSACGGDHMCARRPRPVSIIQQLRISAVGFRSAPIANVKSPRTG
jgi:hypothetical protein